MAGDGIPPTWSVGMKWSFQNILELERTVTIRLCLAMELVSVDIQLE
jgi:hypothetical protein